MHFLRTVFEIMFINLFLSYTYEVKGVAMKNLDAQTYSLDAPGFQTPVRQQPCLSDKVLTSCCLQTIVFLPQLSFDFFIVALCIKLCLLGSVSKRKTNKQTNKQSCSTQKTRVSS